MVWFEHAPGFRSWLAQNDYHEGTHQEGSVGLFGIVQAGVVVNLVVAVLLVIDQLLKFLAEQMDLSQIEWTEISEEGFVDEVVIDAEVESVSP